MHTIFKITYEEKKKQPSDVFKAVKLLKCYNVNNMVENILTVSVNQNIILASCHKDVTFF